MFCRNFLRCISKFPNVSTSLSHIDVTCWSQNNAYKCISLMPPSDEVYRASSVMLSRHISTMNTKGDLPPKLDRHIVDYYVPRIKIRKARKTGTPDRQPHRFKEIKRSWNLREIPSNEEAQRRHDELAPAVIENVNEQLTAGHAGRLFAVVTVLGKQHIVKTEDIIVVQGYWPPQLGEVVRLEKVLMLGGRDFSLVGRPLLPRDQAAVQATVVEKTLSHTKINFKTRPRKNFRKWRFIRIPLTFLRINSVCVLNKVNELPDVRGVEGRVFGSIEQ